MGNVEDGHVNVVKFIVSVYICMYVYACIRCKVYIQSSLNFAIQTSDSQFTQEI